MNLRNLLFCIKISRSTRLAKIYMPQHDKDDEFFFVMVNLHANTDFGTLGTGQVNPGVSRVEIHHNR